MKPVAQSTRRPSSSRGAASAIHLTAGLLAASVVAAGSAPSLYAEETRPNILFILTDDQRWDAMGCAGNPIIQTPNMDRLAEQGTLFPNTFCTTSICSISRASFLTGQYARRHGILDFRTPLPDEAMRASFPVLLREAGYRTGFVGKWGLGGPLPEEAFDVWHGFGGQGSYFEEGQPGHLTARLGELVLDFIDRSTPDRPFLLCWSTKAPHVQDARADRPFPPDPRFEPLYAEVTIPLPATATEEAFARLPAFIRESEGRTRWHPRFATPELYQQSVRDYYRLVTGVDAVLGRVMARLRERGLDERTIVILTSDNGFFLGEHGLAGKWLMYEESIRIPLIVMDPRVPPSARGQRREEMALNLDLAPTILELAGVAVPDQVQGRSLVPLVRGELPSSWRTSWFYEHHYDHGGRIPRVEGVRTERWKYVRYLDPEPPYEQLFDLIRDPHEEKNLVGDPAHAERLEALRGRWRELRDAAE